MSNGSIPVVDKRSEWDGPVPEPAGIGTYFWSATTDGRFPVQECPDCGHRQFYPRVHCMACNRLDPEWVDTSGEGTIYSYTVCHTARESVYRDLAPYAVVLVDLDAGVRVTALVPDELDRVDVGTDVEMTLWQVADNAAVPVFRPA